MRRSQVEPVIRLHSPVAVLPPPWDSQNEEQDPAPLPETFEDHAQIHQVGGDVGLAIVQGLQGLRKEDKIGRDAGAGVKQSTGAPAVQRLRPEKGEWLPCATECHWASAPPSAKAGRMGRGRGGTLHQLRIQSFHKHGSLSFCSRPDPGAGNADTNKELPEQRAP